ncbi:MAG: DUF2905 family protein [Thermodesulfobacteriota bacterium]
MTTLGKLLVVAGLALAALGGLFLLAARLPFFGRLPGDITVERPGFTVSFPLGTSLLLSLVLSLVLSLLFWLFRR